MLPAITGDFSISPDLIELDSETGFIVPRSGLEDNTEARPLYSFGIKKKLTFINALIDLWPDISACCSKAGTDRMSFTNHYTIDSSFRYVVDLIKEKHIDQIERVRVKEAKKPFGFVDRSETLKAYRKNIYNPKIEIEMTTTITPQETQERIAKMEHAIDAEVVETVRRIKGAKVNQDHYDALKAKKQKEINALNTRSASGDGASGA